MDPISTVSLQVAETTPLALAPARKVERPTVSTTSVWEVDFARLDMQATLDFIERLIAADRPEFLVTANLNYLMLTESHPRLSEVNRAAAAVLADGNPIVWRSAFAEQALPCRVAGSDLICELGKLSARHRYRIFLLGGAPGIAHAAKDYLESNYEGCEIAGVYSPPFRTLSQAEHDEMLERIRSTKPDILLVAFGQPKGEFWIYDNLQALGVPVSIQLGASFDFLAGTAKRAPRAFQKIGCEWLFRACCEPKRLVPRYAANFRYLLKRIASDVLQKLLARDAEKSEANKS